MKRITIIVLVLLSLCQYAGAQSIDGLWNEVETAKSKDLPKTAISKLDAIIAQAEKQRAYGHLIKAQLQRVEQLTSISPDTLNSAVAALVRYEESIRDKDEVLDAVYCSILGNVFGHNSSLLDENAVKLSSEYFRRSLANPSLLAQHRIAEFDPLLEPTYGSQLFDNDLLHVLANEAGNVNVQKRQYIGGSNRVASMLISLRTLPNRWSPGGYTLADSKYIQSLDSLMAVYGDLPWAGEIAYERYQCMIRATDATPEILYNYLVDAQKRWSKWERVNKFKNLYTAFVRPKFQVASDLDQMRTTERRTIKVSNIRNLPDLTFSVTPVNIDGRKTYLNPNNEETYADLKKLLVTRDRKTQHHQYVGVPEWKEHNDSFQLGTLSPGVYLLEFTSSNKNVTNTRRLLFVSDLRVLCEAWPDKQIRYVVVNAITGQPVANAKVHLTYNGKPKLTSDFVADEHGEVIYRDTALYRPEEVWASTDTDKGYMMSRLSSFYGFYRDGSVYTDGHLFTDRTIYRPGQTVHVGLIVNKRTPDNQSPVIADRKVKFTLVDANNKEVAKQDVVTDSYGTASADFVLPTGSLTGRYYVRAYGLGSVYFNVEEYKRPTFFVEFDELKTEYKIGDTITVCGRAKSYAGVPVQNAKVKYTITSRQATWWRYYNTNSANDNLGSGEMQTDDKGEFRIQVPLKVKKDDDESASELPYYYRHIRFYQVNVNADVTDVGGETHHGQTSIPLGTRATVLTCDMPDQLEKDSLRTITFNYRNAAGRPIDGTVTYWFNDSRRAYSTAANKPVDVTALMKSLPSGKHTLHAICGNDTLKTESILFSVYDKKPCFKTPDWFYVKNDVFPSDGKPLKVQVGSSCLDVSIFYSVMAHDRLLDYGMMKISDAIVTKEYTYKEEYGDGLLLSFAWVKNDTLYTHTTTLLKPLPDKHLKVAWKTFRNRLEPGQQETWTAHVTTPNGKNADAQLMAVMYDKSLDQLKPHHWSFDVALRRALPTTSWQTRSYNTTGLSWYDHYHQLSVKDLSYSRFDNSLFRFHNRPRILIRGAGSPVVYESKAMVDSKAMDVERLGKAKSPAQNAAKREMETTEEENIEQETPTINAATLRENLAETAFFFPALQTDAAGDVELHFTLPESLTTWKVMMLAHDANTNYGLMTDEVIAKKKVMMQPNMPRFLRANDEASISARVINTTEKPIEGTAIMELIAPDTRSLVLRRTATYSLKPEDTQAVTFNFTLPDTHPIYICRMVAQGANHSDGEQNYLAVLSDKELVTNTYPFTMHTAESKVIDLTQLFAVNDSTSKLTLEYTENPAWLILQSLPTYASARDDNAIEQAVAYYVNSLGKLMAQQTPQLKEVIDQWAAEKTDETSLMSSLEKNENLKNIVLNETPWVLDADREGEQKRKLIKFLDEPTMRMRLQTSLQKLSELQLSNGAWTWWKGMNGSIYMTVSIATMMERLQQLTPQHNVDVQKLLDKAYPYIDQYLCETYNDMRKAEKKGMKAWRPSETVINILYLNALSQRKLSVKTQQATNYMLKLMQKRTTEFTIYGKATAAFIFDRNGLKKKAAEYLQSIEEYSVYTEEKGRYYDSPRAYYSWYSYQIPTQVAVIEAYQALRPQQQQTIEELQRWLLQAKRTQAWSTPINSVNAIYAFLKNNMKVLAVREPATFQLNEHPFDIATPTAGLGYVKVTHEAPDMKTLTINKVSDGTSWGAVYAQFMQDVEHIESSEAQLSVKREIKTPAGNVLKVGDKVTVVITITAERDYDFVQVVDKRAACMEPIKQLSGYRGGFYTAPGDNRTCYYFDKMRKGTYVIESEYYIDRPGKYKTGTCTVQCAYAPEYSARDKSAVLTVQE